jgi:hemerythrin-like domain-containing protein
VSTTHTTPLLPTDLPEFLEGFAIIHRAMRRDVDRLPKAIARAQSVDDARALQRWFTKFEREVEHHHHREDEVVWPMLLERAPEFGAHLDQLEDDHHQLDVAMAAVRTALAALATRADDDGRAEADAAAVALRDHLHDHLDREEAAAFPMLAAAFTPEAYAELEKQLLKATSKRLIAFELPFAFDGLPAGSGVEQLAELPLLVRVLHRLVWQPSYDRLVAPLTGR